jgi:adenylylsulfate kinase
MLLIQLTGLSGAGKSTLAHAAQQRLLALGYKVEVIDGDVYRSHICSDLGFSKSDRMENIRRLGFIGLILARQGVIAILAAINPYEEARAALQKESPLVKTVFLSCSLEALKKNDTKGLYKRALLPKDHPDYLDNFTGITAPYEPPPTADLVLHTHGETEEASLQKLLSFIFEQISSASSLQASFVAPVRRALFIGRWQPFHNGHKWLIDNKLKQGIPVLIAVRDIPCDDQNPFTTAQTMEMIRCVYVGQPVEVMAIPDIESVNYGRGVGYEINCFTPPLDIEAISATAIRAGIQNKDESWKGNMDEAIHEMVVRYLAI